MILNFYYWSVSILKMIASYLIAKLGPKVTPQIYFGRYMNCLKCSSMEAYKGDFYCGACGCPKWMDSKLSKKLVMQNVVCPRNRWTLEKNS